MDIWLFRHAQSDFNTRQDEYVGGRSNESPLSPLGEVQSQKLGLWIARQGLLPDVVYASPAVRTKETCRIALEAAGIDLSSSPVHLDDRLQEMSQGPAEGQLRKLVYTKAVLSDIQARHINFALPGGESMGDVADRGYAFVEERRGQEPRDTTFVFTHGFWIRCVVGQYLGWDHAAIRKHDVDNASATCLSFYKDIRVPDIRFNIDTQSGA